MTARPDTGTGRDTRAHVAAGRHATTTTTNRGDLMTSTTPTAGGILAAAAALQDPNRQTFTRAEVAYLMHLAYLSGGTAREQGDINELFHTWATHPHQRLTAEQRIAARLAEMAAAGGDYRGGEVDWETGRPVRRLGAVA